MVGGGEFKSVMSGNEPLQKFRWHPEKIPPSMTSIQFFLWSSMIFLKYFDSLVANHQLGRFLTHQQVQNRASYIGCQDMDSMRLRRALLSLGCWFRWDPTSETHKTGDKNATASASYNQLVMISFIYKSWSLECGRLRNSLLNGGAILIDLGSFETRRIFELLARGEIDAS